LFETEEKGKKWTQLTNLNTRTEWRKVFLRILKGPAFLNRHEKGGGLVGKTLSLGNTCGENIHVIPKLKNKKGPPERLCRGRKKREQPEKKMLRDGIPRKRHIAHHHQGGGRTLRKGRRGESDRHLS